MAERMSDCLIGVHLAYDDWLKVLAALSVLEGAETAQAAVKLALDRAFAAGVA